MRYTILFFITILLIGCASSTTYRNPGTTTSNIVSHKAPVVLPKALLFEDYTVPLSYTDKENIDLRELHKGESKVTYIFPWIFAPLPITLEDNSLDQAIDDGEITNLYYADIKLMNVLYLYQQLTVTAYGTK